ncbi:MAG: hypothetical protein JXR52_08710 [Bacteroidales bacterium]|nr:hypothetical protein [Bacteroidales bacterium]MBN2698893.1 hypothetical protein [Bacteroidales bacterium]
MNYRAIIDVCSENSRISKRVIDDFLIYYAANLNNLEKQMSREFDAFRHASGEIGEERVNRLKAQYLAHRIFREEGLIRNLLNHAELKRLTAEELKFLREQSEQPWRFSFSVIVGEPEKDFFLMEDVFSEEQFLLYSPGVTDTARERPVRLWFNLINYNGACWQSYGPIAAYNSFDADDIFFFATELDPVVEDEEDVILHIWKDPVPYMMLLSGSALPVTNHKDDELVSVLAEYDLESINSKVFDKNFTKEYSGEVYRFMLKGWEEHPHFSTVYYDESKKIILLSAFTERGFERLVEALRECGYDFPDEPSLRVHPTMLITVEKILGKEPELNEYEKLFRKKPDKESEAMLENLNKFMSMVIPEINAGRKPDIDAMAAKAGLDIKSARDFWNQIREKFE